MSGPPTESTDPDTIARLLRHRLEKGPMRLPVSGSSMRGIIESGATVELIATERLRPGEIWAFVADDGTILVHRVRHVSDGRMVGRGSGNPIDDPPVPESRAVGRVRNAESTDGRRRTFGVIDRIRAHVNFAIRKLARRWLKPR